MKSPYVWNRQKLWYLRKHEIVGRNSKRKESWIWNIQSHQRKDVMVGGIKMLVGIYGAVGRVKRPEKNKNVQKIIRNGRKKETVRRIKRQEKNVEWSAREYGSRYQNYRQVVWGHKDG